MMSKKTIEVGLTFRELCILLERCSKLGIKEFEGGGLKIRLDGKIQEPPLLEVKKFFAPERDTFSEREDKEHITTKELTEEELGLLSVEDPAAYEEYVLGKAQDGEERDFEER